MIYLFNEKDMILNFIVGFAFGIVFSLIGLLAIAWNNVQEKKRNNSSTFDRDKEEYNSDIEEPEGKDKN